MLKMTDYSSKIFHNLRQHPARLITTCSLIVALSAVLLFVAVNSAIAALSLVTTFGPLTTGPFAFDVAVDDVHDKVYVSNLGCTSCNGGTPTVTVLDGTTNAILANVTTFAGPRSLAFSPTNHRMYVAEGLSARYNVIDTDTDISLGNFTDTGAPGSDLMSIAVNTLSLKVYAGHGNGVISVLDGNSTLPHTEITHFDTNGNGTGAIT